MSHPTPACQGGPLSEGADQDLPQDDEQRRHRQQRRNGAGGGEQHQNLGWLSTEFTVNSTVI